MNTSEISTYMGSTQVQAIYLGSTLVWPQGIENADIVVRLNFDAAAGAYMLYRDNTNILGVTLFDGMEETDITSDIYYYDDYEFMGEGYWYDFSDSGTYDVNIYLAHSNNNSVPGDNQFNRIVTQGSDTILKTIEISGNVTSIGEYAFADNQNEIYDLGTGEITNCGPTEIILPEGLEVIGNQAFQHGYYSAVTIPSTVTSIGWNAFNVSDEQQNGDGFDLTVTVEAETPPQLNDNGEHIDFGDPCRLTIEVPQGYESDYEADTDWNNYMTGAYCIPETCGEQGLCDDGEGNCIPCE